jgi:hypothetical protein
VRKQCGATNIVFRQPVTVRVRLGQTDPQEGVSTSGGTWLVAHAWHIAIGRGEGVSMHGRGLPDTSGANSTFAGAHRGRSRGIPCAFI